MKSQVKLESIGATCDALVTKVSSGMIQPASRRLGCNEGLGAVYGMQSAHSVNVSRTGGYRRAAGFNREPGR